MADISLKRAHSLGLKGARTAANKMAEQLAEKFSLSGDWSGNTLNFSRAGVNGVLQVSETEIHLEVTLGFMLKMMKGPIEQSVNENLDKVLKHAKPTVEKGSATKSATAKKPPPKKPVGKK